MLLKTGVQKQIEESGPVQDMPGSHSDSKKPMMVSDIEVEGIDLAYRNQGHWGLIDNAADRSLQLIRLVFQWFHLEIQCLDRELQWYSQVIHFEFCFLDLICLKFYYEADERID